MQKLSRPDDPDERGPATCGCGRPAYDANNVNIHLRPSPTTGEVRAGVSGVYRCGSPWLCPVCAVWKAFERAEKVREVAEATFARGGRCALVVLTASHDADTPLKSFIKLVQGASSKSRKGKTWEKVRERFGILGVMVGQEITISRRHGWHYHQHLSIPVDGPTPAEIAAAGGDEKALAEMVRARAQAAGRWIAEAFKKAVRKAGGKVSDKHGTRVRTADDAADASDYTAKGSLAWEVAGGYKDKTKAKDSLTPWDLVELAFAVAPKTATREEKAQSATDAEWARARWAEYAAGVKGLRSCVQTASLKKNLNLTPTEPDQGDEQQLHDGEEVVGRVEAPTWRRWMRHGLASTFLARVELDGEEGFDKAVSRTQDDAQAIEDRYAARDAARAADESAAADARAQAVRDRLLKVAAARIRRSGNRTLDQIRRAIDDIAEQYPDASRLSEMDVLRALAAPEPPPMPSAWDDLLSAA